MELIEVGIKPVIYDDWDYEESVSRVKPIIGRWKKEARDIIIPDLWNAHEHCDGRGHNRGKEKVKTFTFSDYCDDCFQAERGWKS